MPRIHFRSRDHDVEIDCPEGANLRMVLLHARLPLYTKVARAIHCRGRGSCGTCAVHVDGAVSEPTPAEEKRMKGSPFSKSAAPSQAAAPASAAARKNLRLACQCSVLGDLTVTKGHGFFGQHAGQPDDEA